MLPETTLGNSYLAAFVKLVVLPTYYWNHQAREDAFVGSEIRGHRKIIEGLLHAARITEDQNLCSLRVLRLRLGLDEEHPGLKTVAEVAQHLQVTEEDVGKVEKIAVIDIFSAIGRDFDLGPLMLVHKVVLTVDNNPHTRLSLRLRLTKFGFGNIIPAVNGAEALRLLSQDRGIDLVVVQLHAEGEVDGRIPMFINRSDVAGVPVIIANETEIDVSSCIKGCGLVFGAADDLKWFLAIRMALFG